MYRPGNCSGHREMCHAKKPWVKHYHPPQRGEGDNKKMRFDLTCFTVGSHGLEVDTGSGQKQHISC